MIECKICGKKIKHAKGEFKPKTLFMHIGRMHKIKNYEYVKQYEHTDFEFKTCGWCNGLAIPDIEYKNKKLRLVYNKYLCDNKECKKERKKHNPRSYLATIKTYKMTEQEAKDFVSSKSPFHRNYFKSEEEYTKFQSNVSLEEFQNRYGKRKGSKKYQEYVNCRQYINSIEYFIDKYGKEKGTNEWEKFNQSKAITRQKMIDKYGKEKGHEKYENFLDKTLKNFVSKSSIECLNYIAEKCNLNIRHGKNNSEKKIRCEKTTRPVDGYCHDLNIVFEFYGDRWHMNPNMYTSDDLNPRKKEAKNVWNEDRLRLDDILPEVNAIFIIWEYDWNNNKERIISRLQKCLSRLRDSILPKSVYFL